MNRFDSMLLYRVRITYLLPEELERGEILMSIKLFVAILEHLELPCPYLPFSHFLTQHLLWASSLAKALIHLNLHFTFLEFFPNPF